MVSRMNVGSRILEILKQPCTVGIQQISCFILFCRSRSEFLGKAVGGIEQVCVMAVIIPRWHNGFVLQLALTESSTAIALQIIGIPGYHNHIGHVVDRLNHLGGVGGQSVV